MEVQADEPASILCASPGFAVSQTFSVLVVEDDSVSTVLKGLLLRALSFEGVELLAPPAIRAQPLDHR